MNATVCRILDSCLAERKQPPTQSAFRIIHPLGIGRACPFSLCCLVLFRCDFFKRRIKIVMFYICTTCIHGVISSKSMERRKSDSIFCLAKSQSFEYIRLTKALLYHLSISPPSSHKVLCYRTMTFTSTQQTIIITSQKIHPPRTTPNYPIA